MIPTEFQRNAKVGPGAFCFITLPAAASDVSYVLTQIVASISNTTGVVTFQGLNVFDGATLIFQRDVDGQPNAVSVQTFDVILFGNPGTLMKVEFAAVSPANMNETLSIRGYLL